MTSAQPLDYVSADTLKQRRGPMILLACLSLICALVMYPWARWVFALAWVFWIGDKEQSIFQTVIIFALAGVPLFVGLFAGVRVLIRARGAGGIAKWIGLLGLLLVLAQFCYLFVLLNSGK